MDTDHIFLELFREHPEWLRALTGLPLPPGCRGSSLTLKQLEIRCDLLLEPAGADEPHFVVEFQIYHDHSVFNRAELARQIVWKQINPREDCRRRGYRPREIEAVVLFGSRSELPASHGRYPQIRIMFLDELIESLEKREPESPLVAALAPLRDPLSDLENRAASHYRRIKRDAALPTEEKELLTDVFLNLLLQRFKTKSREEIRKMIAELTPLHETRAGRELFDEGIEKGIEKGRAEGELALTLHLLARKFPNLPATARKRVEALDENGLLAFGEALLFFTTERECLDWLERRRA